MIKKLKMHKIEEYVANNQKKLSKMLKSKGSLKIIIDQGHFRIEG